MDKQFYNAYDIADIMGICYAKALAFIKYSGIDYVKMNRTYLVHIDKFNSFIDDNKNIVVEL